MITRSSSKCRRVLHYTARSLKRHKSDRRNVLYIIKHRQISKVASVSTLSVYLSTNVIPYEWMCGMFGGAMIGGGTTLMLAFHGRIAGVSGLLTKLFDSVLSRGNPNKFATCSQLGFVAGILASGIYWNTKNVYYCGSKGIQLPCVAHKTQPYIPVTYSPYILALGGLLVGIGTRLGSGCTTGHGICGLARQSPRSLAAVGVFFSTAVVTTTVMNVYYPHLYQLDKENMFKSMELRQIAKYGMPMVTGLIVCGAIYAGMRGIGNENLLSLAPSLMAGYAVGTGLVYSGMSKPDKVRGFLDMNPKQFAQHWDPTLGAVMFGAVALSGVAFPVILKLVKRPVLSPVFHLPIKSTLDQRLLVGSTIFGLGWGIGGICPGPGFVGMCSTEHGEPMYIWFLAFFLGNRLVLFL